MSTQKVQLIHSQLLFYHMPSSLLFQYLHLLLRILHLVMKIYCLEQGFPTFLFDDHVPLQHFDR